MKNFPDNESNSPLLLASRNIWLESLARLTKNKFALAAACVIILMILIAILAPVLSPFDPIFQDMDSLLQSPNSEHLLGTDNLGRDILSRLIYGARISLAVGLFTQIIALAIGIPIGAIAGLGGRHVDNILMRLTDIAYAFPDLLLIILFKFIFGNGIFMIFLAIGIVSWVNIARLIRGQFLSLRERNFIEAARSMGAGKIAIILQHLLPNSLASVIVVVTFGIPRAIFAEAALSYIGIGIQPPAPSWGTMIQEGTKVIFATPYPTLFPALAIALVMIAFSLVGDGLRDAFDPKTGQ